MQITDKTIRNRLKTVMDPELNVNIVDLGLIYKVKAKNKEGKTKIYILMTLTSSGCPLAGMFDALVKNSLKTISGFDAEKDVKIELTFDPPWTPEMMTEEVRAELGFE